MCVVFHGTYPTDNIYMIYYDILCLIQVLFPYINKLLQSPGQNMVVPNVSRLLWWSFHHCWWKRPGKRLEMITTNQDSGSYSYHTYHNIRMQRDFHWINWFTKPQQKNTFGYLAGHPPLFFPPKKRSYFQQKLSKLVRYLAAESLSNRIRQCLRLPLQLVAPRWYQLIADSKRFDDATKTYRYIHRFTCATCFWVFRTPYNTICIYIDKQDSVRQSLSFPACPTKLCPALAGFKQLHYFSMCPTLRITSTASET